MGCTNAPDVEIESPLQLYGQVSPFPKKKVVHTQSIRDNPDRIANMTGAFPGFPSIESGS